MSLRLLILVAALCSVAASHRTRNFVVTAPTPEIARQVGEAAEHFRRELAIDWLGYELPCWYAPCPIKVKVGQIGAGGATTFNFAPDQKGVTQVYGWDMQIQGSLERILDSVLPHEISHTIFACHFRRPLPRWADEGAATIAEADCEKKRQVMTVKQVLNTRRRIPLKQLVEIQEYPKDMQDVLTLYAEGYSIAELLVQQGGKARYLKFLQDAHQKGWDSAIAANYGYRGVDDLEKRWTEWVVAGSPEINSTPRTILADAGTSASANKSTAPIIRGQSPTPDSQEDPFLKADIPGRGLAVTSRGRHLQAPDPETRESRNSRLVVTQTDFNSAPTLSAGLQRPAEFPVLHRAASGNPNPPAGVERLHGESPQDGQQEEGEIRRSFPLARLKESGSATNRGLTHETVDGRDRQTPWSEFPVEPRRGPAFQFAAPTR